MDRTNPDIPSWGYARRAVTSTTTIVTADRGYTVDCTSGTYDVALTAAATLGAGFCFGIYNSGSGVITINPDAAETIRTPAGSASTLALSQGQGVLVLCDGTGFEVVASAGLPPTSGSIFPINVPDDQFNIIGSSDPTKRLNFEVDAQTTGDTLTIDTGAQTDSRTATFPVLTGNSILTLSNATLTSGRVPYATTNGILTDSANLTFNGTVLTVSTRAVVGSAPFGIYGFETSTGFGAQRTSTDASGAYVCDFRKIANTTATAANNSRVFTAIQYGAITSGQSNTGAWTGFWVENIRNYIATSDGGSLAILEGGRISYGHFNTDASTPSTTTVTGLRLLGYRSTGTMTTMIGLHVDNGSTSIAPTTGYGIKVENVGGTTRYAIHTGTGLIQIGDTTDSTSKDTGSIVTEGGIGAEKNIISAQNQCSGVSSTATAAGTTTLTSASRKVQIFTGTTTQTINFPAANVFGAGIAVELIIINRSTGTVTPTRAGSDTFVGGGTTDPITTLNQVYYVSDGVSVWYKLAV